MSRIFVACDLREAARVAVADCSSTGQQRCCTGESSGGGEPPEGLAGSHCLLVCCGSTRQQICCVGESSGGGDPMDGWRPVSFRLLREAERKGRDWALKSDSVECRRGLRRHGAAEILQVPTVESRLGGRPGAALPWPCDVLLLNQTRKTLYWPCVSVVKKVDEGGCQIGVSDRRHVWSERLVCGGKSESSPQMARSQDCSEMHRWVAVVRWVVLSRRCLTRDVRARPWRGSGEHTSTRDGESHLRGKEFRAHAARVGLRGATLPR